MYIYIVGDSLLLVITTLTPSYMEYPQVHGQKQTSQVVCTSFSWNNESYTTKIWLLRALKSHRWLAFLVPISSNL